MKKSIFLTLAFSAYTSAALAGNLETTTTYLFEFDSAKINAASQKQLNNINNESNITKIAIDGYSDKLGPVVKNQKLAQDRAENVKHGLLAKNIDPKLVIVAWHGSQNSLASERCFSELGKDNYWVIERLKKDLAQDKFNVQGLTPANAQLKIKLKHELSEREAKQDKLAECTAPDRRVIVVVTSLAVMPPAVAAVVPVVAAEPIKAPVNEPYDGSGVYVNINAGYGSQQFLPNGTFAGSFNAGYNFNRAFALEGGAALLAGQQYNVDSAQMIFDMAVKGTIPLSDVFSLYGRLGAGFSTLTYNGTQNSGPSWFANSSGVINSMVGLGSVGGSFKLDRHFDLRVEDTYYIPLGSSGVTSGNVNQALVGVQYNF